MSNEKATLLKTSKGALVSEVNGVTYFKLKSEFDGDYTKNCGLLGEEIDKNFYFLRGYDIESVEIDENKQLVITRVDKDYDPIVLNLAEEISSYKFSFDKSTGCVTITFPDGHTEEMGGFLVEGKDIRIATDDTLNGDGTIANHLGISDLSKTGTYAPANEFLDFISGGTFPEKEKGYRIVTRETSDTFGRLYPFGAVELIQKALENANSPWRIPTKDDWDELLDAFEPVKDSDGYMPHSSTTEGFFGKIAGSNLKSTGTYEDGNGIWKKCDVSEEIDTVEGINLIGGNWTLYPLGKGSGRSRHSDVNNDIEGFREFGAFWANTTNENGLHYTKKFNFDGADVEQRLRSSNDYLSIRLCKDYNYSNFNEYENILGLPYPCSLIQSPFSSCTGDYVKIWTSINVYFADEELSGLTSDEWSAVTDSDKGKKINYFLRVNNGSDFGWSQKLINEGESIVILDYASGNTAPVWNEEEQKWEENELVSSVYNHEWRLYVNGDDKFLVDTVDALKSETKKDIDALNKKIISLSAATSAFSASVISTYATSADTVAAIEEAELGASGVTVEAMKIAIQSAESYTNEVSGYIKSYIEENDGILSGRIDTLSGVVSDFSASVIANYATSADTVNAISAATVEASGFAVSALEEAVASAKSYTDSVSGNIESCISGLSAATVEEIARLDSQDIKTDSYTIEADTNSKTKDIKDIKILRNDGKEENAITISVDDSIFDFGTIIPE